MKAVFGLGNPGDKYRDTRHNAGARVIDAVMELRSGWRSMRYEFMTVWRKDDDDLPLLVKSETYMNHSGLCAKSLLDRYEVTVGELLVVSDEVQLPLGSARFSFGGSHGGHNGLRSVIEELGDEGFTRLRLGVAPQDPSKVHDLAKFVLDPFEANEVAVIKGAVERAAEGVLYWSNTGLEGAMNRYNGG